MRTGPSLQWKGPGRGKPPLQAPSHRPSLLSVNLVSCHLLIPCNCFLHSFYARTAGHKNWDIIGESGDSCPDTTFKWKYDQGWICLITKPMKLQGKNVGKRRQGAALPHRLLNREDSERFPFTCTTVWGLWYRMLIHLWNPSLNLAASKTAARNRWSSLSKALD